MGTLYFYKLTVDDGGAPCVHNGLMSLAICKPMIRTNAERGSIIFGFAANSLEETNPLLYIAVVTDIAPNGSYYDDSRFIGRPDRIYARRDRGFKWRAGSRYHGPADLVHDLGPGPVYRRAQVLLSNDFRYFGSRGTAEYKSKYLSIKQAVERLGQGHRVNHPDSLREQLLELKADVWKASKKVLGAPYLAPDRGHCHRERSCGSC